MVFIKIQRSHVPKHDVEGVIFRSIRNVSTRQKDGAIRRVYRRNLVVIAIALPMLRTEVLPDKWWYSDLSKLRPQPSTSFC